MHEKITVDHLRRAFNKYGSRFDFREHTVCKAPLEFGVLPPPIIEDGPIPRRADIAEFRLEKGQRGPDWDTETAVRVVGSIPGTDI